MIWPLRYSAMLEHGKCASGSSSGFCGANAMELDAIGLLQRLYFSDSCYLGPQVSLTVSILRTLKTGLVPFGTDVPFTVTLCPRCLAKPSVGKPSASNLAMVVKVWSFTKT